MIIRAVDNETDPASIISIFKFKSKKNSRKAELSSLTSFIGSSENNLDYVKFEAKKFKQKSYLLTLENIGSGEYGVIVKTPNGLDQKNLIVYSFGIK